MSSLESVVIKLRSGRIQLERDRVVFERQDGRGRADLPLEALDCLKSLQNGVDLESFILGEQTKGKPVDYISLKKTVLGLYYGNCVRNHDEIAPYLEAWNYPPLKEPLLFTPFLRARPRQAESGQGMFVFILAAAQLLAWVALQLPIEHKSLSELDRFWIAVFLSPGAALSFIALFVQMISVLLGQEHAGLGARLSPLGLHFEVDSAFYRLHPRTGLVVSAVCALFLPIAFSKILMKMAPNSASAQICAFFLENLGVGLFAIQLLPGLKTSWAQARFELIKRGNLLGFGSSSTLSFSFLGFAIIGLISGFSFSARSVIESIRVVSTHESFWKETSQFGVGVLALSLFWSFYMIRDMLSGIENLADDYVLFAPLQVYMDRFQSRFTMSKGARSQKEIEGVLNTHPLFQRMPPQYRAEITRHATLLSTGRGSRLIRQGTKTPELYILLSGSVGVYRRDPDKPSSSMVVRLTPGSVFGEAGFFFDEPRSADVIALEPIRVLRIRRPQRAMFQEQNREVHEQFRLKMWATQAMASSDLFRALPHEALFHILDGSTTARVEKNEILMREGDPADQLWICIQGSAQVIVKGVERPKIQKGGVVGEIGLLWKTKRTATVVSDEDSIFLKLPSVQVQKLLSRNVFLGARLQEVGEDRLYRDQKISAA